ncbi:hypothetical protein NDN08_003774 [Rhodosorus marinus]|uniref:CCHC-type domain-containing protein n=1 Tax=Rhodosorus marinus TaxID=101924 RepID=A0AAV8UGE7_9RHOD|nr:hypothetical protein NDN08_003774 [Rhodosorus marinus]
MADRGGEVKEVGVVREDVGERKRRRKSQDERDVRYFAVDEVLCSRCGLRGHLSWACPEPEPEVRCFICGKPGHVSKDCQKEVCYYCGETGHKSRECPQKSSDMAKGSGRWTPNRGFSKRASFEPKPVPLKCYVCHNEGHLDCSLSNPYPARLSCFNCGELGHSGLSCTLPNVNSTLHSLSRIIREDDPDGQVGGRKRRRSSFGENPEKQKEMARRLYERLDEDQGIVRNGNYYRRSYGDNRYSWNPPRGR